MNMPTALDEADSITIKFNKDVAAAIRRFAQLSHPEPISCAMAARLLIWRGLAEFDKESAKKQ